MKINRTVKLSINTYLIKRLKEGREPEREGGRKGRRKDGRKEERKEGQPRKETIIWQF